MLQITQVRVQRCPDITELLPGELGNLRKQPVDLLYGQVEVALGAAACVVAVRLDDLPQKSHPLLCRFQDNFIRMDVQANLVQFPLQLRDDPFQMRPAAVHKQHIVHIAAVTVHFHHFFDMVVEIIEIYVAKHLGCQVSNGQAGGIGIMEKAFAWRQAFPVAPAAFDPAVPAYRIENGLLQEIPQGFQAYAQIALFAGRQHLHHFVKDNLVLHVHEIGLDVQLEDIRLFLVIVAAGPDKMSGPFDATERAFAHPAAVGIVNQLAVDNGIDAAVQQVMHNAVCEIGRENFAHHGFVNNKCDAGPGCVGPLMHSDRQLVEMFFLVHFKPELVMGIALVFAGVPIGQVQLV